MIFLHNLAPITPPIFLLLSHIFSLEYQIHPRKVLICQEPFSFLLLITIFLLLGISIALLRPSDQLFPFKLHRISHNKVSSFPNLPSMKIYKFSNLDLSFSNHHLISTTFFRRKTFFLSQGFIIN